MTALPSNPLLLVYVLGAYGWGATLLAFAVFQPAEFKLVTSEVAERDHIPYPVMVVIAVALFTVLWPTTTISLLVQRIRGGSD